MRWSRPNVRNCGVMSITPPPTAPKEGELKQSLGVLHHIVDAPIEAHLDRETGLLHLTFVASVPNPAYREMTMDHEIRLSAASSRELLRLLPELHRLLEAQAAGPTGPRLLQ